MTIKKILLVDDEILILYTLSYVLQDNEVEVLAVTNAEDALVALEESFYDLCFLDIRLPGMDGLQAMQRIKKISPSTQIAIMSASSLDRAAEDDVKQSAHYFLAKPFDLDHVKLVANLALKDQGLN